MQTRTPCRTAPKIYATGSRCYTSEDAVLRAECERQAEEAERAARERAARFAPPAAPTYNLTDADEAPWYVGATLPTLPQTAPWWVS